MRAAMHGLMSSNILWRKNKFGFEAPTASWIKQVSGVMELAISPSPLLATMCRTGSISENRPRHFLETLRHRQMASGLRGAVRCAGRRGRLSRRAGQPISMMK
ncbi:MAG TPA: hypothetical protein VFS02_20450 [Telluria sp.]|nr:hypothetical protein [Telluria sp.]